MLACAGGIFPCNIGVGSERSELGVDTVCVRARGSSCGGLGVEERGRHEQQRERGHASGAWYVKPLHLSI